MVLNFNAISKEDRSMISIEWKTADYFPTRRGIYSLESPKFFFSGAKWWLTVHPNGQDRDISDWIGLFLTKGQSVKENHRVTYHFGIRNADGTEFKSMAGDHVFGAAEERTGSEMFVERSILFQERLTIGVNDDVTFFFKLHSKVNDTKEFECQTTHSEGSVTEKLVQNLKNLLVSEEFSDLTLKVKTREFRVHRVILAAHSSVFAAMIRNSMKENSSWIIEIEDCDQVAFQLFLNFIYSGDIEKFSMDTVWDLFDIAKKYDAGALKKTCIQFIIDNLSAEIFCDVLCQSLRHNESELLDKITEYFAKNLKKILVTDKWESFVKENPVVSNDMHLKAIDFLANSKCVYKDVK